MGLVSGKVALVTGSGTGIGRATALKFAEEGAKVIVSDVSSDGGNETVALIKQQGGDAAFTRADVAKASEIEALVANAVGTYGRLDCACNNAGIEGKIAPLTEQPEDNFDRVISINAQRRLSMPEIRNCADAQEWRRSHRKSCVCCGADRITRAWPIRGIEACH